MSFCGKLCDSMQCQDVSGLATTLSLQNLLDSDKINARGFNQTGPGDTMPPSVLRLDFWPRVIDTSTSAITLSLSFVVEDDASGVTQCNVGFRSPRDGSVTYFSATSLASGTRLSGTLTNSIAFPQFSASGMWYVALLFHLVFKRFP